MNKYEYKKICQELSDDELNQLGINGWELVAVTETTNSAINYFKRTLYQQPVEIRGPISVNILEQPIYIVDRTKQ